MNIRTTTSLRLVVAGALLGTLALSFATTSSASVSAEPPQVTVKFADLDIATSKGARALYGRIYSASVNVCSQMYGSEISYKRHKDACLQKVIGDAVVKVNRQALTAVFAAEFGQAAPTELASAQVK
jgi:UrcA family protein